jgi:hypothetical protein
MFFIVEMVDLREIFLSINPSREKFIEELKEQRKVLANRISRSETISTLATIQSEESTMNGLSSGINEGLSMSNSSTSVQARSFSSVTNAQELEDLKSCGDAFDEVIFKLMTNRIANLVPYFGEKSKIGSSCCSR